MTYSMVVGVDVLCRALDAQPAAYVRPGRLVADGVGADERERAVALREGDQRSATRA
jgi:hypothetical protein